MQTKKNIWQYFLFIFYFGVQIQKLGNFCLIISWVRLYGVQASAKKTEDEKEFYLSAQHAQIKVL